MGKNPRPHPTHTHARGDGREMLRVLVLVGAALSACLSGWAIQLQIEALTRWRADDLFLATTTTDFAAEGTCVSAIDAERIEAELDGHHCTGRGIDADPSKPLRALRDALAASVHGLLHAATRAPGDTNLCRVAQSVLSSTVNPDADSVGTGINFTSARAALDAVASASVPTSCDAIYNYSRTDLYLDDVARTRYDALLARDADHWPLAKVSVDCDNAEHTPPSGTQLDLDAVGVDAHVALLLYAHCRAQFEFAASGIDGKFRVPILGKEPGPTKRDWYPWPEGFKRDGSVDYNTKTRVYLGARFGHSVWAYVPMLLVSAYLCADATVLLLAEATLAKRLEEVNVFGKNVRDILRDSLILRATSRSARVKRFAYAFAGVLVSIGMWTAFVGFQWGFLRPSMVNLDCTNDGWNDDADARWNELAILAIQVFVLFIEGVLSSPLLERCNRCSIDGATPGRNLDRGGVGEDQVIVDNTAGIQRVQRVLIYPLAFGGLLMVAGQAASGVRFGSYFAEGLLGVATRIDPTTGSEMPAFDPKVLGSIVFDQTVATGAIAIVVGLVVGAALQRQLLRGVGCTSAVLFVAWLGLVCVFALPLLVYAEIRSIFYDEDASLDCAHVPDGYDFDKFVCRSRFFTLIGGGALVFGTVLAITAVGLLEAIAAMMRVRKRAKVPESIPILEAPLVFDRGLASSGHADSGKLPRVFALKIKK